MTRIKVLSICCLTIMLFARLQCAKDLPEDNNHHQKIMFVNNTEHELYLFMSYNPDMFVEKSLDFKVVLHQGGINKVSPFETNGRVLSMMDSYWETVFEREKEFNSDTLWLYVLDAYKLEVEKNYGFDAALECYGLTLADLRKVNWKLTYPPTEEMKEIKMFPSFEEVIRKSKETDTEDNSQNQ